MTAAAPSLPATLRVEQAGPVARLMIDNPKRKNAISFDMWRALPHVLAALERDDQTRVIVLAGAGALPFSAGADISEFETVRATAEGARDYEAANAEAFAALARVSKPTIAMLRGFCLGGGLGLAIAADLRIAAEGTQFGIPAARLGVGYMPECMRQIVASVGMSVAKDLFFTGRRLDAAEAKAAGLVQRLVPEEALEAETDALARTIADNAPLTIRAAKAAIDAAAALPHAQPPQALARLADACFDSADYREGRTAFLEKRRPHFEGR